MGPGAPAFYLLRGLASNSLCSATVIREQGLLESLGLRLITCVAYFLLELRRQEAGLAFRIELVF